MGTGPVFLEGLECLGTESSLLDCAVEVALGLTICGHSHDSGIRCYGKGNTKHMVKSAYVCIWIIVFTDEYSCVCLHIP